MKVVLTPDALTDIENIHNFHLSYSEEIAIRITEKIFDEIRLLERFPDIGVKEPLPANSSGQYQYFLVVKGKFKVIYKVENDILYIISVWDCRRNPQILQLIIEKQNTMQKEYEQPEENPDNNTVNEPAAEYGIETEMTYSPPLTEEEEKELITGEELMEDITQYIHELFAGKK